MEKPTMKATLVQRSVPLLIATMLAAAPAWAQPASTGADQSSPTTAPTGSPGGMSNAPSGTSQKAMPHPSRSASARQPGETMQNLVERRIADLHSRLQITPQQSQQWDQFAQVMRANAKEMDQAYQQRADRFSTMTAVDNMQSFAQIEQERAQNMQKLVPAFQALYDSLSDQQKKTADQMFRTYAASAQSHHQAAAAR
jgi:periplasmic protein CpxP/Spy